MTVLLQKELKQLLVGAGPLILGILGLGLLTRNPGVLIFLLFITLPPIMETEGRGRLDFLLVRPVSFRKVVLVKYMTWWLVTLPLLLAGTFALLHWDPQQLPFFARLTSLIMMATHFAFYDLFRRHFKSLLRPGFRSRWAEYPVAMLMGVLTVSAVLFLRGIIPFDHPLIETFRIYHGYFSAVICSLIMLTIWHAFPTKTLHSAENSRSLSAPGRSLFSLSWSIGMRPMLLILGISMMVQLMLAAWSNNLEKEGALGLFVLLIGAAVAPWMTHAHFWSHGAMDTLLVCPVSRRKIMVNAIMTGFCLTGLIYICSALWWIFVIPGFFGGVTKGLTFFAWLTVVIYTFSTWLATASFAWRYCPRRQPDRWANVIGSLPVVCLFVAMIFRSLPSYLPPLPGAATPLMLAGIWTAAYLVLTGVYLRHK